MTTNQPTDATQAGENLLGLLQEVTTALLDGAHLSSISQNDKNSEAMFHDIRNRVIRAINNLMAQDEIESLTAQLAEQATALAAAKADAAAMQAQAKAWQAVIDVAGAVIDAAGALVDWPWFENVAPEEVALSTAVKVYRAGGAS